MTDKRLSKIRNVVAHRQKGITLILENIHDSHNVSAILRSAESAGIDKLYLVYNTNKFPKIGRISSGSAKKWVELIRYKNISECYEVLKKDGYSIYSTYLDKSPVNNKSLFDIDLTKNSAIVIGNEHEGVSEEAVKLADGNFIIPMYGMVESLNVSVTAAVCLYEALRQRELNGMYKNTGYTEQETVEKLEIYLGKRKKQLPSRKQIK
ncbi:RNA methyltransferase [soil metagenome]